MENNDRLSSEFGYFDHQNEGRDNYDMDVDRMVNEGLGGGNVTYHNGLIEESTTQSMGVEEEEIEADLADE